MRSNKSDALGVATAVGAFGQSRDPTEASERLPGQTTAQHLVLEKATTR